MVDGCAHQSSNDLAVALQPILATPERCKDAKELKERLTAWSLKVAEKEHQCKAIDEAQKTFVVREMIPKDIKREFLAGPWKFDEIMEKLETITNEINGRRRTSTIASLSVIGPKSIFRIRSPTSYMTGSAVFE